MKSTVLAKNHHLSMWMETSFFYLISIPRSLKYSIGIESGISTKLDGKPLKTKPRLDAGAKLTKVCITLHTVLFAQRIPSVVHILLTQSKSPPSADLGKAILRCSRCLTLTRNIINVFLEFFLVMNKIISYFK